MCRVQSGFDGLNGRGRLWNEGPALVHRSIRHFNPEIQLLAAT